MANTRINPSKLLMHFIVGGFCLLCLLPMLMVISISLTSENSLRVAGYSIIPPEFSTSAYRYIFTDPMKVIRAYGVSATVTLGGAALGLWCTTAFAYTLSRKDFAYRGVLSVFIFITMLFSGGLAPTYIMMTQMLGLKDNLLALILPGVMGGWHVFLMKGFLTSVPPSVIESAKMDGASEFRVFARVVLPMSTPGLATIGLFLALGYWNEWFGSLLYIESSHRVSLQFLLYKIMANIDALRAIAAQMPGIKIDTTNIPSLSARMAMCVVAAGPMIVAFAFLQKYFAKGITLGSIKG
jgi:putative aldouronate transport system permease protein